jgi:hypothetical protein
MSKATIGKMKAVSNCFESEEVHLILTIWSVVRSYYMQARIVG